MQYKGIIFDLDGVICSTDQYHYLAWSQVAELLKIPFDEKINNRLRGVSRMKSLEIILEKYSGPVLTQKEIETIAAEKNRVYRESLKHMGPSDLSEEVQKTLNILRGDGLKLAVGSSSKNALFILERIGLSDYFDVVIDGNAITHSKPDPEVFLKAAADLCLNNEECLVVEDAVSGAAASHAAKMQVACLGSASSAGAGDFNLKTFAQLLDVINGEYR